MYEKLKTLRSICDTVGVVALFICIMLCAGGKNSIFIVMRVITAAIALTAFSIKCGAEVMSDEKLGYTIFLMSLSLFDIIIGAINFI